MQPLRALVSPLSISLVYGGLAMFYVFLSDQVLAWFIRNPDQLTTAQTIKGWGFVVITASLLYAMVNRSNAYARRVTQAFVAVNQRFRAMVETTNEGVWFVDVTGKTLYANVALARIFGVPYKEVTGTNQREYIEEPWATEAVQSIPRIMAGETSLTQMRFRRPDHAECWGLVSSAPFYDRHGDMNGVLRMVTDISEQKAAEARLERALQARQVLINELDHRVRNTLSAVLTLIKTTEIETKDMAEFSGRISGRIFAICTAHAMLLRSIRRELPLEAFISAVFSGFSEGRIQCEGPRCFLPYQCVVPMALTLHELRVWSERSGALSKEDGRIQIQWDASNDRVYPQPLSIIWQENQTAEIASNSALSLAQGLVKTDMGGALTIEQSSEGSRFVVRLQKETPQAVGPELAELL